MRNRLTRVLDAAALARIVAIVGFPELYDRVSERLSDALAGNDGDPIVPREREGFIVPGPEPSLLEWMPAMRVGGTVSVKLVGYNPHNTHRNTLPTILSTLCGFDSGSGHLRVVLDGTFPTALRTGVTSALASRLLARPDAAVLGIVGAGAQAVTQLHALARVFPLTRVLVHDTDPAALATFRARARGLGDLVEVTTPGRVQRAADIICTCTSVLPGEGPVIDGAGLSPDVHINAVGSDMPGKTELPVDLLRAATVCPDLPEQAVREGECQRLAPAEIGPSLVDLFADRDLARRLQGTRTVFDATGLALADLVMVEVFEELADRHDIGAWLEIESSSGDPRDPYAFLGDAVDAGFGAAPDTLAGVIP